MADVKLLSTWFCPFGMRVVLALEAKNIHYDFIEQESYATDKSALLLQSNPVYKKIPVLIHNGNPLPESMIIVQYIDETWPEDDHRPGFLSADPYERSLARFWADFMDKKLLNSILQAVNCKGEEKERAQAEFVSNCLSLNNFLSTREGPFIGGKTINTADIALSPFAIDLPSLEEILGLKIPESCQHLQKFLQSLRDHPVVKASLPSVEKKSDFLRTRLMNKLAPKCS